MQPYQQKYIENVREIAGLLNFYSDGGDGFEAWFAAQKAAGARVAALRAENVALLNDRLFPALDGLYGASEEEIAQLEAFADALMDWRTNLDCGVYVVIHEALLKLYRVRRDRNGVIKMLYKLGMGLYYQRRGLVGIVDPLVDAGRFQNGLAFTEAGSYMRYFDEIDDEPTRGYIIRALANVALCAKAPRDKIAASARALEIIRDAHYRALAPGLPWDAFLRKTHQQMSANRAVLSKGGLSTEELAAILDSCYEVFKPEDGADNPSVRWLWPYYEMEFNCGYVDLKTTADRLEALIDRTPCDRYDASGVYANTQLVCNYGLLLRDHPALRREAARVRFLDGAYRKMLKTLLTIPPERMDDYFFYHLDIAFSNYYEMEGVLSYRELTAPLMRRFSGALYVRSRRAGDMLRRLCGALLDRDAAFFDDIPFLKAIDDPAEKRAALLDYARDCGLYHDFGLIKMNITRTEQTRSLFEGEYLAYQLHTVSGHADLSARASTRAFADIALGHHSAYNGADGYPARYVRTDSPFRQMTDAVAVVSRMLDAFDGDMPALLSDIQREEGRRFSPMIVACLSDPALTADLERLLRDDGREYYRTIYETLNGGNEKCDG